jgi:hypothetical protein
LDVVAHVTVSTNDGIAKDPHFAVSETPAYVGRAVAALAADPRVLEKSGRALTSWGLAAEYDFDDADGRRPDIGEHFSRELQKSWAALLAALEQPLRAIGLEPATDLVHDRDRRELRARLNPDAELARWFSRDPSLWELLLRKPEELAAEFVERYRAAGSSDP